MSSKRAGPGAGASGGEASAKRRRTSLTLQVKLDILNRVESGETNSALGRHFNLGESTIRRIKSQADKIREAVINSADLSAKVTTKVRNPIIEKMEKLLNLYIENENKKNQPLSNASLRAKALSIYDCLCQEEGVDPATEPFQASVGWYAKFIKRYNLHNLKMCGEQGSADSQAATTYKDVLKDIIKEYGFSPKQVFNADETGLFWKKMPQRTYISKEEKTAPGTKAAKDRLTLLLCANADGDCKMKPLLIYHSANPRALKGLSKNMLPVHWDSNKKAWVTGQVFEDWFTNHFAVEAERYCREENLAFKVLLVLDNAPGHPHHLDSIHPNITVRFLPPNTTSLIQPLDQGVISTFKAYYLRRTFAQLLNDTDDFEHPGTKPTIREWWKAYTIRDAITNIASSWMEVKSSTLNGSWKNLWQDAVNDFRGFTSPLHATLQECAELGHKVTGEGFSDMNTDDVMELILSHQEPMSVEDLIELSKEQQAEEEDEDKEDVHLHVKEMSRKTLAEFFQMAENLSQFAMDMDHSLERSQLFSRGLEHLIAPYKELYLQKQNAAKQTKITSFLRSPTPSGTPTPLHSTPVPTSPASSEMSLHLPGSSSHEVFSPEALLQTSHDEEDPDEPAPLSP